MPTSKGYTGQRADAVTGLDYYGARYYDPLVGQFTSADDVLPGDGLDPWGLSRYAYVEGNPIARNDPSGHYVSRNLPDYVLNPASYISAISAVGALGAQIKAAGILVGTQHTVVRALDYPHNVEYWRMRNQGASAEKLIDYATDSYTQGYVTNRIVRGGRAANAADAAVDLMEGGRGLLRAAKFLGYAGLAIGAAVDYRTSGDEWLQQHPGDTSGAVGFGVWHAGVSTALSVGGAWAGGLAGAALGATIGSVLPGPGTVIGGYVGGFVGSAVGGYLGSVIGDAIVDGAYSANVNNPVSSAASAVSGWFSSL